MDWVIGKSFSSLIHDTEAGVSAIEIDESLFFKGSLLDRLKIIDSLRTRLQKRYDGIYILHRDKRYSYAFRMLTTGPIFQVAREKDKVKKRDYWLNIYHYSYPIHSLHESLIFRDLFLQSLYVLDPANHDIKDLKWDWSASGIFANNLQQRRLRLQSEKKVSLGGNKESKKVVIHIGGGVNAKTNFDLKVWPHWAYLIESLLLGQRHLSIVLVGAPTERESADKLVQGFSRETEAPDKSKFIASKSNNQITNKVGETRLIELVEIISEADQFIGVDSGPLHIADALGVPCIGLYGPTSEKSWGLMGANSKSLSAKVSCAPCYGDDGYFPPCANSLKCMKEINPKVVLDQLDELWS